MRELTFTFLAPFGGCGAGARGFLDAAITLPNLGARAKWECLGGIDIDPLACRDFEYLTGVPELCADMRALTAADVRARWPSAPDCVFTSAPCQGASGLLPSAKAKTQKYRDLNDLALVWARLMVTAWDEPPKLLIFENVPGLPSRAPEMLRELRRLLKRAGYLLNEGFHDCGELGGLAQRRRRWLMVARQPKRCPPILYQPVKRKVRGCGDVLEQLPVPATLEAATWGRMHVMPKISMQNWVRLAMIPAGGDWRDLNDVLAEGQPRREKFKRHRVEDWSKPTGTIAADSGSNGVQNIADPRPYFRGVFGVTPWEAPSSTVTTESCPANGRFSVADHRVNIAYDAGYKVLGWDGPSQTVATKSAPGNGTYSVADIRVGCSPRAGTYGVLRWDQTAKTIIGEHRIDAATAAVADPRKPPPFTPVILSPHDGTWHRPLTILELAALQGFPLRIAGKALDLAGGSTRQRKAIGMAVPPPAAQAIGEQMLVALTHGALEAFSLSSNPVWVVPAATELHA
jgi:site-specific DNA-cytosine methylase